MSERRSPGSDHDSGSDPVLQRRATIAKWSGLGRRVGFLLYGLALVVFFVGLATDFPAWAATTITACILAGAVALIPAIVFGYGVKAAEREEREERAATERRHESSP